MADFFEKVEKTTGVDFDEVIALANAISYVDFQNERQVRKIVRKVAKLAKKDVSKDLEDRIVTSILKNGDQLDMSTIEKMLR